MIRIKPWEMYGWSEGRLSGQRSCWLTHHWKELRSHREEEKNLDRNSTIPCRAKK